MIKIEENSRRKRYLRWDDNRVMTFSWSAVGSSGKTRKHVTCYCDDEKDKDFLYKLSDDSVIIDDRMELESHVEKWNRQRKLESIDEDDD
jgi:hypothetical protein